MRCVLFTVFLVLISVTSGHANKSKGVALVVGNSGYFFTDPLPNAERDAEAVSQVLVELGFDVIKGIDVDYPDFITLITEFVDKAKESDVAIFYYAGHAVQANGENYLIPVDARIEFGNELRSKTSLDFGTFKLNQLLSYMEGQSQTNLIFLDACRDNPIAKNLATNLGTRSLASGSGLAPVETGIGTMIAYATQPGNVALDGRAGSENSPFTKAILNHIRTPGLDVALLLRRVRTDVMAMTNGMQVPWTNSSLTGSFSFADKVPLVSVPERKPDERICEALVRENLSLDELLLADPPSAIAACRAAIRRFPKDHDKQVLLALAEEQQAAQAALYSMNGIAGKAYLRVYKEGRYTVAVETHLARLTEQALHEANLLAEQQKVEREAKEREARVDRSCGPLVRKDISVDELLLMDLAPIISACRVAVDQYPDDVKRRQQLELVEEQQAAKTVLMSSSQDAASVYLRLYPEGIFSAAVREHHNKVMNNARLEAEERKRKELELKAKRLDEDPEDLTCEILVKQEMSADDLLLADLVPIIKACRIAASKYPRDEAKQRLLQLAEEQQAARAALTSTNAIAGNAYMRSYQDGAFEKAIRVHMERISAQNGIDNDRTKIGELHSPAKEPKKVTISVSGISDIAFTTGIQEELTRLGCRPGAIDGKWGQKSRSALERLVEHAEQEIELAALEPSQALMEMLQSMDERICPLVCSVTEELKDGLCISKGCPSGQRLSSKGVCYVPKSRTAPGSKTVKPSSGSSNCLSFEGQQYCQ